jgi:hypothetical protein
MHVSHTHRFLYLAVSKTGSRTVSTLFAKRYGAVIHAAYHSREIPAGTDGYLRIASVRNPFSRMVSFWSHVIHTPHNQFHADCREMPFAEFVLWITRKRRHSCQVRFLEGFFPQHILRLESLADDLARLPFVHSIDDLPQYNRGYYQGDWQRFYTPELIEHVRQFAAADFDAFGYSPEFPATASEIHP